MTDMINKPSHYIDKSGIECIEITRHMGFCGGNCFKYLYRAGKKGCVVEDLGKARKYAVWAHENLEHTPINLQKAIVTVAQTRGVLIYQAMYYLSQSNWELVIGAISRQIEEIENAKK